MPYTELEALTLCHWVVTAEAHLYEARKRLGGMPDAPAGLCQRLAVLEVECRGLREQLRAAATVAAQVQL